MSRERRNAVERGDIRDGEARKAAEGIAEILYSNNRMGAEDMADLFSQLSEAVNSATKAEREALETLRAAMI